ncbi:ACP phosphodiesterase [Bacteroidota bacterium]
MNILAHAFLSKHSTPLMIGNFIADFVKGNQFKKYETGIARGIILHRYIDDFTDKHPVFLRSKDRIREHYRHYSAVVIDVFYDHYLARDWSEHAGGDLEEFTVWVYKILKSRLDEFPEKARMVLPYIVKGNWLLRYADKDGIDRSLKGMAARSRHNSGMENAINDLNRYYQEFEEDFREFLPQITAFVKEKEGILQEGLI